MANTFTTTTASPTVSEGFTDSDFVKLNLPPNANFSINGVTMTITQAVTAALAEVTTRAGALAMLFAMLEADHLQSETIGKYSYSKWAMRGSDYWKLQDISASLDANAPNIPLRPRYGCPGVIL